MDILQREQIEIEFWKNSPIERPESEAVENLISKFCEARIFLEKIQYHQHHFESAQKILELGAGQGWASCFVKNAFPDKYVIVSDISEYAIQSVNKWEYLLKTSIDEKFQCRSHEIPSPDESIDLIFCFEAAHHFSRHPETLMEIHRVLKKGGACLYLHEPACRQYLHKAAYARVNRKRPEVPEDVLIYPKIQALAKQAGLESQVRFDPSTLNRAAAETIYYFLLQKIPLIQYYVPCSVDFVFKKP